MGHSLTRLRTKRRSSSRRAGFTSARRLVFVATLALCLLGHSAALADSSSPIVTATVFEQGGKTLTDSVSLADLQANPGRCQQYQRGTMDEHGPNGVISVGLPPKGEQTGTWGLGTILGCMQTPIALPTVKSVTVIGADGAPEAGGNSQLTPADLQQPSDFNNTAEVPVIEAQGSTNEYDRPWRGGSDFNYLDEVTEPEPISIDVFEGPHLTVSASASQTTVAAGGSVTFTATVSPANQGKLTYSWNFDGQAASSASASPQVQFNAGGQFVVSLQVTDASGGGGVTTIPIDVTSTGPTTPNPKGTSTGPTHSSGNTPGSRAGKRTTHAGSPNSGHNANGNGSESAAFGNRSSSPQPTNGTSGATGGTNAATGAANAATGRGNTGSPHRSTKDRTHSTAHGPKPVTGPQPSRANPNPLAVPVKGLLISDVTPVGAGASPLVHAVAAPPASAPAIRTPTGTSPWPIVGAAAAVLLLLGLGAARELRGRTGWRPLGIGAHAKSYPRHRRAPNL